MILGNQSNHFVAYDSLNPYRRDEWEPGADGESRCMLWGTRNIGKESRSNVQAASMLVARDQMAVVKRISARTNVRVSAAAWEQWLHVTGVIVVVGTMPVANMPIARLLAGEHIELSSQVTYDREQQVIGRIASGLAARSSRQDLSSERWTEIAQHARTLLGAPLLIVPGRQLFKIQVHTNARALGALIEVGAPCLAPECLITVDVTGVSVDDVE